jgi:hypothetical protein
MKRPEVVCAKCCSDLELEYVSVLIGSSKGGWMARPCCDTELTNITLSYVEASLIEELQTARDNMEDELEDLRELFSDLVASDPDFENKLDKIAQWQTSLGATIADLASQFVDP